MGRLFLECLEGPVYCCKSCRAQLAKATHLLSNQFHSKNGPACLFETAVNVFHLPPENRLMTTGNHVVADIACIRCMQVVGWKYEKAFDEGQKYKEGKYILERAHVVESCGGPQPAARSSLRSGSSGSQRSSYDAAAHSDEDHDHYY